MTLSELFLIATKCPCNNFGAFFGSISRNRPLATLRLHADGAMGEIFLANGHIPESESIGVRKIDDKVRSEQFEGVICLKSMFRFRIRLIRLLIDADKQNLDFFSKTFDFFLFIIFSLKMQICEFSLNFLSIS